MKPATVQPGPSSGQTGGSGEPNPFAHPTCTLCKMAGCREFNRHWTIACPCRHEDSPSEPDEEQYTEDPSVSPGPSQDVRVKTEEPVNPDDISDTDTAVIDDIIRVSSQPVQTLMVYIEELSRRR